VSGANDSRRLFVPSPEQKEDRSHWANLSYAFTDETMAHASAWCEQTPITSRNDSTGSIENLIHRFGERTVARALAGGNPELLVVAARAGLLLAHVVGDHPRAQLEGPNDQLLALVMEAAPLLGTSFDAVAPFEPPSVVAQFVAQSWPSQKLNNSVVLVERWGVPMLAQIWDDAWAAKRPKPFTATFDWLVSRFPWEQIGPVTLEEPGVDDLAGGARARRLATEFARTGQIELGVDSVRVAVQSDVRDPAWMALWVAHRHAGAQGVATLNTAIASAGLPAEPDWIPPVNSRVGEIAVTDPWAGPFFDRLLTTSPAADSTST